MSTQAPSVRGGSKKPARLIAGGLLAACAVAAAPAAGTDAPAAHDAAHDKATVTQTDSAVTTAAPPIRIKY